MSGVEPLAVGRGRRTGQTEVRPTSVPETVAITAFTRCGPGVTQVLHDPAQPGRHQYPARDPAGDGSRTEAGPLPDDGAHLRLRRELEVVFVRDSEGVAGLQPGGRTAEQARQQPVEDAAEQMRAQPGRERLAARPGRAGRAPVPRCIRTPGRWSRRHGWRRPRRAAGARPAPIDVVRRPLGEPGHLHQRPVPRQCAPRRRSQCVLVPAPDPPARRRPGRRASAACSPRFAAGSRSTPGRRDRDRRAGRAVCPAMAVSRASSRS